MSFLRNLRLLGRSGRRTPAGFGAALEPDAPFFAIGDIHGQMAELKRALAGIIRDAGERPTIVCVGDYIDRGERSADVLRHLRGMAQQRGAAFTCLMGNHEQMCLRFLDDPENSGDRWFRNGGLQTLASFGVQLGPRQSKTNIRDTLAQAMGDDLIAWLRGLSYYWVSGNVAVTHAGADPRQPIAGQPDRNLLWGHPEFQTTPRTDGIWVVHGHTIVDQPQVQSGRVAIDTGAYATGRLTVAHFTRDGVSFVTT